jgi:hypothetical protein
MHGGWYAGSNREIVGISEGRNDAFSGQYRATFIGLGEPGHLAGGYRFLMVGRLAAIDTHHHDRDVGPTVAAVIHLDHGLHHRTPDLLH